MSSRLTSESRIYADKARDLNRQVCILVLVYYRLENHTTKLLPCEIPESTIECTVDIAICLVHRLACEDTFVLLMKIFPFVNSEHAIFESLPNSF